MSKYKHRIERLEKKTGEKKRSNVLSIIRMFRAVEVFDRKGIDISEGPALSIDDLKKSFMQYRDQLQDPRPVRRIPGTPSKDPRDLTDDELEAEIEREMGRMA